MGVVGGRRSRCKRARLRGARAGRSGRRASRRMDTFPSPSGEERTLAADMLSMADAYRTKNSPRLTVWDMLGISDGTVRLHTQSRGEGDGPVRVGRVMSERSSAALSPALSRSTGRGGEGARETDPASFAASAPSRNDRRRL